MNDTKRQIAFSACILLLYAAFMTRTYYWDGVLFSLNIESVQQGQSSPATLFHPNHLLYSAFGWLIYAIASACGLAARAITILQAINVAASVAAGYILFVLSKRTKKSHGLALFCWALFAFGATWWKFSTDADPYILSVPFILLGILLVVADRPRFLLAAICHTLAMLLHELTIFVYVPIVVAILLNAQWPKVKRFWHALTYVIGTGACVAVVYLICYSRTDRLTYPSLLSWITSYATNSGFTQSPSQLVNLYLASYLKLFVGGKVAFLRDYFSIPVCFALAILLGVWLWALLSLWRSSSIWGFNVNRKVRLILWAWLLPYVIFLASWDPGSAFHKLFLWPAMVLLIGEYTASTRPAILLAIAISIAAWNFAAFIYPHSHDSADPVLMLAKTVDKELPKDATIYYRNLNTDDWYLEYFAPGRHWLQLPGKLPAGPACLETTALESVRPIVAAQEKWNLVNTHHNIRLECFASLTRPGFERPARSLR